MASGKSLTRRYLPGVVSRWFHQHKPEGDRVPYRNLEKDRTLAGKARRRARRAA